MITVNGEPVPLDSATLADLLFARLDDRRPRGVAVAVNDEVVLCGDWPLCRLADGDAVEIVTAVQGG
jgi:sulfur carrier protein